MGLTKTALTRPVFILMLMLTAFLLGALCYNGMRKELNPEVNFATVMVGTAYPGAGPEDINELVTRKVEQAVSGVNGIRQITSVSQEGFSAVVIALELGIDSDKALSDVRSKVDSIQDALPKDVLKPTVTKFDNSSSPVLTLAFSSDKLTSRQLRDLLDDKLSDRFSQIQGVAAVNVQGGDVREIQVRVKKDKLLEYGLGMADVQRAVSSGSVNAPSGHIVQGLSEYTVRVKNDYQNADQIRNMIISVTDPNNPARPVSVRLSDIADVADTVQERGSYSRLNGKDTIALAISKERDGNSVEINDAANLVITGIQKEFANDNIQIVRTYEDAKQITDSLSDLRFSLMFSVFLVASIVFVFLHDWRGTLIVTVAIPTSIFATFIALKAAGFTINSMTMLALTLAIGVLVDDAIVVLENIYRHLRMGEDPRTAAINGRSEIGLAAIAITMADVVVFLPIAFMGGIVGQFFKPMALGFVFATLFSLFVSFTVTPLLAARWYRAGEDIEHPKSRFARGFERGYSKFEGRYRRALEWALNHRWLVFVIGNAVLFTVFAFIGGSSVSPKPPLGATGADADLKQYAVSGAWNFIVGQAFMKVSIFIGILAIGASHISRLAPGPKKNAKRAGLVLSVLIAALLISFKIPAPDAIVLIPILWAPAIGIVGFFTAIINRPARLKMVGYAIIAGLMFPLASVSGYAFAQWKKESVFKFSFLPDVDSSQVVASIELPPGSSLAATQGVVSQVERTMMADPDVKYVLATLGSQSVGTATGSNAGENYAGVTATLYDKGSVMDRLKHQTERLRWNRSDTAVASDLTHKIGKIPGAKISVAATGGFGFGSPVQIALTSDNRPLLEATAQKIKDRLAEGAVQGVLSPDTSSKPGVPELRVVPDPVALADTGLDAATAGSVIRTAYQGDDSTKLRVNGREYTVRVMLDLNDRNNPDILSQIPLKFSGGNPVFLSSIAKVTTAPGIDKITRLNRAEEVSVTASILPGYANGTVNAAVMTMIQKEHLVPPGVSFAAQGQADAQGREMGYMLTAFVLGFVLVYMLLASLYNNVLYPFIIQMAQPQAMVGAMLALMITNKSLNLVGFIGLVCLVGLVGKNAILVVDYTNTLRGRGRNRHDALVEAAPTRLRPIMMTTMALILGIMPVALALGRGSEFRDTIGITIIGGISLSTLLTLFVIPCSYTIFDDLALRIGRVLRRGAEAPLPEFPEDPAQNPTESATV